MMRVGRVVVALPLLASRGARLVVLAMPGERAKDIKKLLGRIVPAPGSRTDKKRVVATTNEDSM